MRSITTFDLQYAHRFYGFQGEAQYLHGHTGVLTIEVEDSVNAGVNMVYPCNEIQKVAWDVLKNFDHALVLRQDDPLLPAILDVYEKQGIKDGSIVLSADQKRVPIPWFMVGFILASVIGTFVPLGSAVIAGMVKLAYLVLGMAMAALGMSVNFKVLLTRGRNALMAAVLGSLVLLTFVITMSKLFF